MYVCSFTTKRAVSNFYGSFILLVRDRISTKNTKTKKQTLHKSYKLISLSLSEDYRQMFLLGLSLCGIFPTYKFQLTNSAGSQITISSTVVKDVNHLESLKKYLYTNEPISFWIMTLFCSPASLHDSRF